MPSIRNYSTILQYQDVDSKIKNIKPFSPLTKQIFATSGSIILSVICGIIIGFSAIALPQLCNSFVVSIDDNEASWIASITALAMPIGGIFGYVLLDYFARRHVLLICSVLCVAGWLFISLANTVLMLYIGRFLTGLYIGLITPSCCIYVAEISEPHYRGFLLGFLTQAASVGMLLVHVLGTYLNWRVVCYVCICIQLIALVLILFSPETPTWLICNGRTSKAESTFYWLRPNTVESEDELKALLRKYVQTKLDKTPWLDFKYIISPLFLKPFFISAIFFITQQFSGSSIIIFYTVNVVKDISPNFDEYTSTIILDIIRVIASVYSCWLLKKYDRRTLLAVSSVGSVISIFGLALFVKFPQQGLFGLLPVLFVITYVLFSVIGLIPLPWITASEIFPVAVRELGNGVSTCFAFAMVFVTVKIAPFLFKDLGIAGTFTMLGAITLIGSIIIYIVLPETNNKSLQRVEEDLYEQHF